MSLPRKKLLAVCVGAVFAHCGISVAQAQSSFGNSAVGADTAMGNAMNPPGHGNVPGVAVEDFDIPHRTPTGQLYNVPTDKSWELSNKTEGGTLYSGSVEIGIFGGDPDAKYSKYREYRDPKTFGLNTFSLQAEQPGSALFLNLYGGGVGNDDQFYDLQLGRYNDWRIRGFYTEIPHLFSTTFRPLYVRSGDNRVSPNPVFGPETTITANGAGFVAGKQALPADEEIGLIRKRMGLRGDVALSDAWKFYATATTEKREGERPYSFMGVEGIEPIEHQTTDFTAGFQYFKGKTAANLRAQVSIFENDVSQLLVDNIAANRVVTNTAGAMFDAAGQYYLYTMPPDNQNVSVKGDASHRFDFWNARLSGGFSWGVTRNDDDLRMPIPAGFLPSDTVLNGTTLANWDGTNGCPMSRCKSDLKIESTLFNLGFSMDPTEDLTVRANARQYENKNKSATYYGVNSLVPGADGLPGFPGGYGDLSALNNNDLGGWANGRDYFSPGRSDKQTNYTLSAEYMFGGGQTLDLSYEREDFKQTYRERDETNEDKFKLTYVGRNLFDFMTVRASFEHDKKRGSFYDPLVSTRGLVSWMELNGIPYNRDSLRQLIDMAIAAGGGANVVTLPNGATFTLDQISAASGIANAGNFNSGGFMKTDQADRDQNIFNARLGFSPTETIDLGLSVQVAQIKYPGNNFGVQKNDQNTVNLDFTYQPSAATQISAYYSRQYGKQQAIENYGNDGTTGVAIGNTAANQLRLSGICGTLVSSNIDCWLSNARDASANAMTTTKSTTDFFGFSVSHDFGWARVGLSYSFMDGETALVHSYGMSTTAANLENVANFGDYPDMTSRMQSLELNVVKDFTKRLTGRLVYQYHGYRGNDWHYDYYSIGPNADTINFNPADMGPENYNVNVIGFLLQYKF